MYSGLRERAVMYMLIDIKELPVENRDRCLTNITIKFPVKIGKLQFIRLVNNGKSLDYLDEHFAEQYLGGGLVPGRKDDTIYISFIREGFPNIRCVLRVEEIVLYSCSICERNKKRRILCQPGQCSLDGSILRISSPVEIEEHGAKYHIMDNSEFIWIQANSVIIEKLDTNICESFYQSAFSKKIVNMAKGVSMIIRLAQVFSIFFKQGSGIKSNLYEKSIDELQDSISTDDSIEIEFLAKEWPENICVLTLSDLTSCKCAVSKIMEERAAHGKFDTEWIEGAFLRIIRTKDEEGGKIIDSFIDLDHEWLFKTHRYTVMINMGILMVYCNRVNLRFKRKNRLLSEDDNKSIT